MKAEDKKLNKEKKYLKRLYYTLIQACKKSRYASNYFKKKGTQKHIVLKAQGKVKVLSGLIINLEDEFGYRIHGKRYIDSINEVKR